MSRCRWPLPLLALLLGLAPLRADVKLPAIFSDHLVLQRGQAVPVWGWAAPGEEVTVSVAGQQATATANAEGKWSLKLPPLAETKEPQTLTVKGKNTLTIKDVLIGEVWLASGQSNMAMTVNRARDFEKEKAAADHPQIRTFTVARSPKREPQADCKGQWVVCSPETVGTFSAAAYFFGRLIQREVGVPVGLINSSYGGTDVCAWTSEEAMKREPAVEPVLAKWARDQANWDPARAKAAHEKQLEKWQADAARAKAEGKPAPRKPAEPVEPRLSQNHPANLYNGMIAPVLPYAIKGALWYQGEANSGNAEAGQRYKVQLPLLIADWRARWGQGDFPFAWVQLPNYNRNGEGWMLVREAMLESLKVPHTGMAVTTDVGDPGDIHPTNKQAVGERLAWWALAAVYGRANVPASSPLPGKHEVAGKEVVVTFAHTGGGLTARGGGEVRGFVIAGADKKWLPAKARIEGDRVIVWHPDVAEPAAVRYNWAANPDGNLFNATGQLPATPFRTDRW